MMLPETKGALEIAIIVRNLSDIRIAADIIEQYARTVASGARLDAAQEAYDRILGQISKEIAS